MKRILIVTAFVLAAHGDLCLANTPVQTTIYVAPEGKGSGRSVDDPCSIMAARDFVRTINGAMTGNILVQLAGGVYHLEQPLELIESNTIHDSGSNGFDIVYQAAPGANPILSGGLELKDWSLFDKDKNIYRAQVPAGTQSRQLFINGVRAERTRGELSPKGWIKIQSGWGCMDLSIVKWRNPSDIEIVSANAGSKLRR